VIEKNFSNYYKCPAYNAKENKKVKKKKITVLIDKICGYEWLNLSLQTIPMTIGIIVSTT